MKNYGIAILIIAVFLLVIGCWWVATYEPSGSYTQGYDAHGGGGVLALMAGAMVVFLGAPPLL